MIEIEFPFEFVVYGTPVSHQATRSETKERWKALVREAAQERLPKPHFVSSLPMAVTILYFMAGKAEGDIDNIVKLILDACSQLIFLDDAQVNRLVIQRFEPAEDVSFSGASDFLIDARDGNKPAVYVRLAENRRKAGVDVIFA
jgi:crossover junction endodeoxyribonuclease RusA